MTHLITFLVHRFDLNDPEDVHDYGTRCSRHYTFSADRRSLVLDSRVDYAYRVFPSRA